MKALAGEGSSLAPLPFPNLGSSTASTSILRLKFFPYKPIDCLFLDTDCLSLSGAIHGAWLFLERGVL